ncbi:hypothetical protein [Pedobacter alpinus]|uniref:Uncharacterized protein n=1 Tax=Pedobacter alpinus TaxID=1590643 RepID=A0ABW5TNP9_9SPHI
MRKILVFIFVGFCLVTQAQTEVNFVKEIEKAHNAKNFHKHDLVSFDIDLVFGGKSSLKGKMISSTNSNKIKLIKEDGTVIVFDGDKVWITPAENNTVRARFDVFTWQYFFMATFKLSDNGTNWKDLGKQTYIANQQLYAAELTFDKGTGDASGDYYIVYKDDANLIKGMGYIVTFGGKSLAEAEKNAHAIVYSDYLKHDGVSFPRKWTFHNWNKISGISNEIGEAKITNIKFLKNTDVDFDKPIKAEEVKLNN